MGEVVEVSLALEEPIEATRDVTWGEGEGAGAGAGAGERSG